jgi:hypothetical protein
MAITPGSAWLAGTGLRFASNPVIAPAPTFTPPPPGATPGTVVTVSNPTPPTVAGMEPSVFEAILYGKDIPLFVGGKMLVGGRICEGPWFAGTQADPTVSFVAYHAHNIGTADYSDTVITQARLRGQEVWNTGTYTSTDKLPNGGFDWRPGHNSQSALPQSIARYGASAIAYTEGIISSWTDIPLKPFGGIIPFPSVLVENSRYGNPADGIPRQEAISRLFDYMRIAESEYEVDVSGSDPAWMVGSQITMEEFLRQLRAIFVHYQITYTDKIRIIEPSEGFSISANLTNNNVMRGTLKFKRTDPMILPREKRYTYIDVDRDYEMNVAVAKEDRFPIPTTDAINSTSIELPIATTAAQAVADIHGSLYAELSVRSQMEGVVNSTLFGMECGDGIRFADSSVIDMTARVMETVHDFENFTVQFQSGEVLRCEGGAPTSSWISHYENPLTNAAQSFSIALGEVATDRVIVLAGAGVTNNRTITSVTIDTGGGPVAMTIHDQGNFTGVGGAFHDIAVFLASLAMPTGTTATVVVTYTGILDGSFIDVYRLTGLANPSAPSATAKTSTTGATNPSTTIDVPVHGMLIGVFAASDINYPGTIGNFGSVTWTGVNTENSDEQISSTAAIWWGSVASQAGLSAQTGRTVSATNVVQGRKAILVGAWS